MSDALLEDTGTLSQNPNIPSFVKYSESSEKQQRIIEDYWICLISREASLTARREVLTGKGKFGITGDGKEVPQVAMAHFFKQGDWRSGYYRDQTLMFALGISTVEDFFAQLYSDTQKDPFSGGRQMNSHYATPNIDEKGNWNIHTQRYNVSSDISSTAGQMARALGLAQASKLYRRSPELDAEERFSANGSELCFVTIGDASTSEGIFWETLNAAGVLQVPMMVNVWDDGYGISVPKKYQTTKECISELAEGFRATDEKPGFDLYRVNGWDYPALVEAYRASTEKMRECHRPALFHVEQLTQPQGHSTSGSHERYKSKKRLEWEREYDCVRQMAQWMIKEGIANEAFLEDLQKRARTFVKEAKTKAWKAFTNPVNYERKLLISKIEELRREFPDATNLAEYLAELKAIVHPGISELLQIAKRVRYALMGKEGDAVQVLSEWIKSYDQIGAERYHTHLYSTTEYSALTIPEIKPEYDDQAKLVNGYQVLNACFDSILHRRSDFLAFGEDVGHIGDVNQGFAGLQEKYGSHRVSDTGIREWSIMGQAIGLAMRGFRPLAEIQYLDYLIYGLEPLSDDLATLRYRSNGQQAAPAIIRTRGHRLEGIWHAGSPMGMLINALRGMYLCVPRNMTQAAGFYNLLLQSDDPALVVEVLNGYRQKERMPRNIDSFTVPLGVPEILNEGTDVTIVTYGACIRVAQKAIELLTQAGISVELIDVQTLLPFDIHHSIVASVKKTNRIVFLDEDVPGGASAYMMQKVLEEQDAYRYLDAQPITITAKEHRPPYGSDGDYFSKPNPEEIFEEVYKMMREALPVRFPEL